MARNWMPIYWGDYHRDTAHLSAAEHGAYLLLIGHYWTTAAPLPDQDARLARIARMAPDEWAAAAETVKAFFYPENGFLRHSRIEEELARNVAITEERSKAGKRGVERKRQANAKANEPTNGQAKDKQTGQQTPQQNTSIPPSPSPSPKNYDSERVLKENAGVVATDRVSTAPPFPADPLALPNFMNRSMTKPNMAFVKGGAKQFAGIGPQDRPKKNPARADQHLAEHMISTGHLPAEQVWLVIMAARDESDPNHIDAARQCEKYSRTHKLGWFHEEAVA